MYAHSIFLADSIISQPDRKVNHWTTNSKSPFYKPIKRLIYSSATFGKRFPPYKSPGPYGYIGRLFLFSLIPLGKDFSSFGYVIAFYGLSISSLIVGSSNDDEDKGVNEMVTPGGKWQPTQY